LRGAGLTILVLFLLEGNGHGLCPNLKFLTHAQIYLQLCTRVRNLHKEIKDSWKIDSFVDRCIQLCSRMRGKKSAFLGKGIAKKRKKKKERKKERFLGKDLDVDRC